ncbi:alanine--tRNA ligase [Parendozoicomonas haliclonae]|uniref:Alanine--tRNA ligase n=1 Tax=Parendozoicomonas haliclonae TaxID=1960125 RepID=A0A1X7ARU6_9GAMM|nr:alanine--tRNA ligase [Parendozoicomonas haliclonae]SMA50955.1 Alanine-tRNA ligase [Parendozoicomonas haliclonae]
MKSSELRTAFLKYFESQGHAIVESSSLVPHDDPTLLFTNAGMNQFKDLFLGREKRDYTRAATAQRCVRAGGKHNDLENVGYTARHHTFFEMLGNFSFGDYFKREAITFAWTFLTEVLQLPKERLCVTIYENDDEAFEIWNKEMGVPAEDIIRIGDNKGAPYASDNFWTMGDTGPCGPCSEIFYDHGEHIWGGRPGTPEEDGDRWIEIWNNVFMQYNRHADGTMEPLPKPSVDTGMGLERIAAVVQGVHSNYEIDLFQHILNAASELLGGVATTESSLRVIADHIRSSAFLIADGVIPSNDGRGYTLRRIIRRACRHGHKLGANDAFFYKLVPALIEAMGDAANIIDANKVMAALKKEEEQFARTLDKGMKILEDDIAALQGKVIPGKTVFTLYDTYGFPVDLTADIARERDLTIDEEGYEKCMEEQRERARAASNFGADYSSKGLQLDGETEFTGYFGNVNDSDAIKGLFVGGEAVDAITAGTKAVIVLEKTPFYAESGGQAGDTGILKTVSGEFRVLDTKKESGNHLHTGEVISGSLKVGEEVSAVVDADKRTDTARNHSATHLAHEALRRVLGEHVQQKGSLVNSDRLRFDFSHGEGMTDAEIKAVEQMVNEQIRANTEVGTHVTDMDTAANMGAMMLFGEKYGDSVRVLSMGTEGFSVELCGGTHVERTGDIGQFVIVSEGGIAAGVRRIEAITGQAAQDWLAENDNRLQEVGDLVKGNRDNVIDKVKGLVARNRELEKEIQQLKQKLASAAGSDMASSAVDVNGVKLLSTKLDGVDPKSIRDLVDQLKQKLGSGVVMLATEVDGKITLAAGVTNDLTGKVKAGDLLKMVAEQVGGKGGGRPDFAQGGGTDAAALPAALASVEVWLAERV